MEDKVYVEKSLADETILAVERDGRKWYLNSRYSDETVTDGFVSKIEGKEALEIYVVIGIANGMYVKKLAEKFPKNTIVVYEPNEEIYKIFLASEIGKEVLKMPRVTVVPERKWIAEALRSIMTELNYKYLKFVISPNYKRLYEYECVKIEHYIMKKVQDIIFYRNTVIRFEGYSGLNYFKNILDAVGKNTLADLKKEIEKYNDRPAVIVAAGPSLDKNIEHLKRAKNRAFIIAADSAVKTMRKHGIMPDAVVTIDPAKSVRRFDMEEIQGIPLICDVYYNHRIRAVYDGPRFYSYNPTTYIGKMVDDSLENYTDTGGSVANNAMAVLIQSGFKNICMIGQDLSYPEGKRYAEESANGKPNQVKEKDLLFFEVESNDGGMVMTEMNMNIYRKWIEGTIKKHEDISFYNATEGGAKINGTISITFDEYLKKFVDGLDEIDYLNKLQSLPTHFTEEEIEQKRKSLLNIKEEKMDVLLENIRSCRKLYEEFNKLNLAHKYDTTRFATVAKKIIELQGEIEEMPEMDLVETYNALEAYRAATDVLESKDTPYEENKDIYKKGMELLKVQEDAVHMFIEDFEKVKEEYEVK